MSASLSLKHRAIDGFAAILASIIASVLLPAILLFYLLYRIFLFGKKAALPDSFAARYGPFIAPILFNLISWMIISFLNDGYFSRQFLNYGLFVFLPFFAIFAFSVATEAFWVLPIGAILSNLVFMACFAAGTWRSRRLTTSANRPAATALALVIILIAGASLQRAQQYHAVPQRPAR